MIKKTIQLSKIMVLLISALIAMTACWNNFPTEGQIIQDLKHAETLMKDWEYGLPDPTVRVIRSQTNANEYIAEVSIMDDNGYATEDITGSVYYKRYDQGWVFDEFIFTGEHAHVHTYPTMEEVKKLLPNAIVSYFGATYEMLDLVKLAPTDNSCLSCEITLKPIENGYLRMEPTVSATLEYAPSIPEMWRISEATLDPDFCPVGIEGEWRGEWKNVLDSQFDVHISSVTQSGFTIDVIQNLNTVNERVYPQVVCTWKASEEAYTDTFLNFVSEPFSMWNKELHIMGYITPDKMAVDVRDDETSYGNHFSIKKVG